MTRILKLSVSALGIAAVSTVLTTHSHAADVEVGAPANYVTVFGGYTDGFGHGHVDNDVINFTTDGGYVLGAALGTHFAPNWRVESEWSFIANGFDAGREEGADPSAPITGRVRSLLMTGNIWRDFDLGGLNPYVGGGLGSGFVNARGNADAISGSASWDDTSLALTGQLGLGVRVPLSDRLQADLGYRFRAVYAAGMRGSDRFGGSPDENAGFAQYIHAVQLGATYSFGPQTIPAPATGDGDWYASVFGGLAVPEDSAVNFASAYELRHKNGFTVGAALGTRITPRLRAEAELSYLGKRTKEFTGDGFDYDPASGRLNQFYVLANMWHDIPMGAISPYFGGGLGFGFIDADNVVDLDGDTLGDKTGVGLAVQVGGGVRAQFSDNLAADVGYRMKAIIEANVGAFNGTDEFSAVNTVDHIFQAGLTYGFGASPIVQDDSQLGNWYVSVFGGGVFPANNHISADYSSDYYVRHKTGFTIGAAVGREVAENMRAELELSHLRYKVKDSDEQGSVDSESGDLAFTYVMGNLWHDWDMGRFNPYAGFGVGLAFTDFDYTLAGGDIQVDDTTLNAAAQVGGGVRFDVTDNLLLDVGYRFKATAGVSAKAADAGDGLAFGHHFQQVVQAGLTWKF